MSVGCDSLAELEGVFRVNLLLLVELESLLDLDLDDLELSLEDAFLDNRLPPGELVLFERDLDRDELES